MTAQEIDFDLADAIESVMERDAADRFWLPSELAREVGSDMGNVRAVLAYMVTHRYAESNGRGGCWERFRSLRYRPFTATAHKGA